MSLNPAWQILTKELPASVAVYALIDCAATAGFFDDQNSYNALLTWH